MFAPAYGAPEQFDDRLGAIGPWTDVYAIALVVLEALADRTVMEGEHLGEFAMKALDASTAPRRGRWASPWATRPRRSVAQALALDPRRRPRDAGEFWGMLKNALQVDSRSSRPPACRAVHSRHAPHEGALFALAALTALPWAHAAHGAQHAALGERAPGHDAAALDRGGAGGAHIGRAVARRAVARRAASRPVARAHGRHAAAAAVAAPRSIVGRARGHAIPAGRRDAGAPLGGSLGRRTISGLYRPRLRPRGPRRRGSRGRRLVRVAIANRPPSRRTHEHFMTDPISRSLFERASRVIPGGVNSPVRAFRAVGGAPVFVARAEGAHLYGADGRRYLDYVGSWGPMILGHAHPAIVGAIQKRGRARDELRRPHRARGALRGDALRDLSVDRDGARRLERHRGDDGGAPRCARLHRARRRREVRGLLPRPCRLPAREGGQRRGHVRRPRLRRSPRRDGRQHRHAPVQRRERPAGALRGAGRGDRGGHRRAGGRQHGGRAPVAGIPRGDHRRSARRPARSPSSTR